MKAVIWDGPHQMHLEELPEPEPKPGQVKLRVAACGICGSDVHGYTGQSGRRTPGQVMGHEFVGTIAALGEGVTGWKVGQRVAVFNIVGCGKCPACLSGRTQACPYKKLIGVNTGIMGAFSEYVCADACNLAALADSVSDQAALLNEPLSVAYHALRLVPLDEAGKRRTRLLVVGGGTIGLCLSAVARVMDCFDIFLLEPIAEKRAMAAALGATALPPDPAIIAQHLPDGADAAIEAVGVQATVRTALEALRPAGTLVLLGNLDKEVSLPLQHISSAEKRLVGSYGFNRGDFDQVMTWLNAGVFDVASLISGTCSLEETPAMFAALASGQRQAVKMVVVPV